MPEKNFVFTGKTGKAEDVEEFEMKPHIRYPMEEGTALITFEEEEGEKINVDRSLKFTFCTFFYFRLVLRRL